MSLAKPLNKQSYLSDSLVETEKVGGLIAAALSMPACIYFEGDLGAGKTTLCKAIIKSLGYEGVVTSPTYNLIQEYPINDSVIYHMDLYRLQAPEELEFLAINDLWSKKSIFLIEWPEKGQCFLPDPTQRITINSNLTSSFGRKITEIKY